MKRKPIRKYKYCPECGTETMKHGTYTIPVPVERKRGGKTVPYTDKFWYCTNCEDVILSDKQWQKMDQIREEALLGEKPIGSFLSVTQAAKLLNTSRVYIHELIKKGKIQAFDLDRKKFIPQDTIQTMASSR